MSRVPQFSRRPGSPSDDVVLHEVWVDNVYRVDSSDIHGGIVVDLGANIGSFALYAAHLGATQVVVVEPEPSNLAACLHNIKRNRAILQGTQFVVDRRGVAGKRGLAYVSDEHGGSRVGPTRNDRFRTEIELVTLDDLFDQHGIIDVDILKIDVEGLEGEILLAASEVTMKRCRYITMEWDQHSATRIGSILEKLLRTHQIHAFGTAGGQIYARRY